MLKILVQWILRKTLNHLSQYRLGVQLDLCIFGALSPIRHSSKWHMSISEAKWTFMPFVLASSITSDLFLTFVVSQASPCLHCLLILQSIAGAIGVSNFLRAFMMASLNSLSSGSMKWIPRNLLALSSFGFSCDHLCFSFSLSFLPYFIPEFCPYMIFPGCHLPFSQSPPGPHISVWKFLFW